MAKTPLHPSDNKRRLKRWALGSYRLGVIMVALACLRALPREEDMLDPEVVLAGIEKWFPKADFGSGGNGLDLSAISKGFAVDRVEETLRGMGVKDFVLGSDASPPPGLGVRWNGDN